MKKIAILAIAALLLTIGASNVHKTQASGDGEATAVLTLSNNAPAAGETVTVTLVVTNVDTVPHVLGAQSGMAATVSSFSCHPGSTFFGSPFQKATYQPGESHTYQSTFIAAQPSCVPNNDWTVYARAQDTEVSGNPIIARDSQDVLVH